MSTTVIDDHRDLAVRTIRLILGLTAVVAVALLAARRWDALPGLGAGCAVGIADVLLLSRSLTRFDGGGVLNPRALAVGMLTRFLSIGILLGLLLTVRALNPLATLVGFLVMPASIAAVGARSARRERSMEALRAGR